MKTLKLIVTLVCATLLLTSAQVFGQSRKEKSTIVPPVKADNFKEIADRLSNDGWKTSAFSIEEQMASTAKLQSETNPSDHGAMYFWVKEETTASSLSDAMTANLISAVNNIAYQVEAPFLSQCQLILVNKGATDRLSAMNKIIAQSVPMVIQSNLRKTMEIYREKDKMNTVQTVYMLNKEKIYDMVVMECSKHAQADKENSILTDVFKEAKDRMENRKLR